MTTIIAGMMGSPEILVISTLVLLLFGAAAIPKFAKSLGQARQEFKAGLKDASAESADSDDANV